jgi:proline iminopeptidase
MNRKISIYLLILFGLFSSCKEDLLINESGNLVQKTVDEDSSLPSIKVNGAMLHAQAFGHPDSSLVIVLHGGPGSDYRYLLKCQDLANDGYRVVFYDQRGTGLSQRFAYNIYDMQLQYDDLSAVIEHYRTSPNQKVFLLGHSWGAMLATAYIDEYPSRITGAILGEPGGFVWEDVETYIKKSRKFNIAGESFSDAIYSDQFITGKKDEHAVLDYKFSILTSTEEDGPIGNEGALPSWRSGAVTFNAYLDLGERIEPNWTKHLSQYQTKVLFIYSQNNKAYGIEHAKKVSSAYPKVQLFETLSAGHDMFSFDTGWNNSRPTIINYLNELNK